MTAMIALVITFTLGLFVIIQFSDIRPESKVTVEEFQDSNVMDSRGDMCVSSEKNKQLTNLNGDGFYNKLMAMHEMKMHHTLCSNMLSITSVKMNLSLDEIIKIRSYIRVADHRMRKYMKKAAPHPYGEVLKAIYNNYDNTKMYTPVS